MTDAARSLVDVHGHVRVRTFDVIIVAALVLLTGCGDDDYRAWQANGWASGATRSNDYSSIHLSSFSTFSDLEFDTIGSGFQSPPMALSPGIFAALTTDRQLVLFDITGPIRFTALPDSVHYLFEMACDDSGSVLVQSTDADVYRIDSSGVVTWLMRMPERDSGSDYSIGTWPLVVHDRYLLGRTNGWVALAERDGEIVWEKRYEGRLARSTAWSEETGIVLGLERPTTDATDQIVSIDTAGEEQWRVSVPTLAYGPLICDDKILVGVTEKTDEGKIRPSIVALDSEGKRIWTSRLPIVPGSMATDSECRIFITGGGGSRLNGGGIVAFDSDGNELWTAGFRRTVPGSILASDQYVVFIGAQDRSIGLFQYTKDGILAKMAPIDLRSAILPVPVLLPNERVVVASSDEPVLLQSLEGGLLGF